MCIGRPGIRMVVNKAGLYDVLRGCRKVMVIGVHEWFPLPGKVSLFFSLCDFACG